MSSRVLIVGLLIALVGPDTAVCAAGESAPRWTRFSSTATRGIGQVDPDAVPAVTTTAAPEALPVPTAEVFSGDGISAPDATRLFRSGPPPHLHVGHHEPPPNYNFRDPHYYPDAGLGFPIRSAHGRWIGGRSGGHGWKHRGYHEDYRQGTFQWRW